MPLHPDVARRLPLIEDFPGPLEVLNDRTLLDRLGDYVATELPSVPGVSTDDIVVRGPHGDIPVRVYRPDEVRTPSPPTLVWLHGGGFVTGDLDMPEADVVARELVRRAGAVVASVDYRLAIGGITYPVPVNDVIACVRWLRDGGLEGVTPDRIFIGGCSAGAAIAASAAVRLRDDDGWLPAAVLVAYPLVHPRVPPATPELTAKVDAIPRFHRLLPDDIAFLVENYVGGSVEDADAEAFAGRCDLVGFAPTLVIDAEYDDLRASGQAFVADLARAGNDVEYIVARGMLHGFLNGPWGVEPIEQALRALARRLTDEAI